jgi:hypothetical protein
VVYLWISGSWPLALLVFFASITVPLLKLIAMTLLLVTTQLRSRWRPHDRAKLYRVVEFVGRWSMLDIFVVAILSGLVQIQSLATVNAGFGAVASFFYVNGAIEDECVIFHLGFIAGVRPLTRIHGSYPRRGSGRSAQYLAAGLIDSGQP